MQTNNALDNPTIDRVKLENLLSTNPGGGGYAGCEYAASWYIHNPTFVGTIYFHAYEAPVDALKGIWCNPKERTGAWKNETLLGEYIYNGVKGVLFAYRPNGVKLPVDA